MPDVQEVFRMATQKVDPAPGFADRQQDHQRRRRRNQKVGAFVVTAAIIAIAVGVFLQVRGGPATRPTTPANQSITPTPQISPSPADVVANVGAADGYSAKLSPDGTTIAFLRDPCQPKIDCGRPRTWSGDPYVLQLWVVNVDGSGLRKIGQQPGCCIAISGGLHWSNDGSRIELIGSRSHWIDVSTGQMYPVSASG
jgi:hypothetical protein